ncbi:MAG: hypothetical protein ACXVHX_37535 [Solirubrobacteraceae bacterium]
MTAIADHPVIEVDIRPPFPLNGPTSASWREQALSKIAELRFVRDWVLESPTTDSVRPNSVS